MGIYPSDKLEKIDDATWFVINNINELSGVNVDLTIIEHSEILIRVRDEVLNILKEWKEFEDYS